MTAENIFRLGTRGSALALAQTNLVADAVRAKFPGMRVEVEIIHTAGDKDRVRSLVAFGGEGVFVKELEQALLEGRIDAAVHSLKDVPEEMDPRLGLAAFLPRESPYDVLVSGGKQLPELPQGALVGTGSPRRVLQLRTLRPDLKFTNLRGNLGSRIAKVESGEFAATLLGAAGLNRLGLSDKISQVFSPAELTPAIGQGIVAIQCRNSDLRATETVRAVGDADTELAARTERRWMKLLGGGCRVPMGALLEKTGERYTFRAYLADPSSSAYERRERQFSRAELETGALDVFADEFIRTCRSRKIPLPSDVESKDALLRFWGNL